MVEIRQCELSDFKELIRISTQTFIETFGKFNSDYDIKKYVDSSFNDEKIKKELSNKNSKFYFIYNETELAGYLKVNFKNSQTESLNEDFMEVQRIYVKKNFQRKQFGEILMKKAIQIAKEESIKIIWLGVWTENIKARTFYMKQGFKDYSEHVFNLGNSKQTDKIMIKEVQE